jgi:hypothetical protein
MRFMGLRTFQSVGRRNDDGLHWRCRGSCSHHVEAMLELRVGGCAGLNVLLAFDHATLKISIRSGGRAVRMAFFAVIGPQPIGRARPGCCGSSKRARSR